jgi:phage tail sheath protein FI
MKTPGVYIVEKNAFPNSVVEVATAVPAFIGHTEIADNHNTPLRMKPWRISSMAEYEQYFGGPPKPVFTVKEADANATPDLKALTVAGKDDSDKGFVVEQLAGKDGGRYGLYYGLRHFFQNNGGACYIVSIADYKEELDPEKFVKGIEELLKEQEPTMVVVPEAVRLDREGCKSVQEAMLSHCGYAMRNRFAILDVFDGDKPLQGDGQPIAAFRDDLGINFLDFAAAYYPWLETTVVGEKELGLANLDDAAKTKLQELMRIELRLPAAADLASAKQQIKDLSAEVDRLTANFDDEAKQAADEATAKATADGKPAPKIDLKADAAMRRSLLEKTLVRLSPLYKSVMTAARRHLNLLPPSAAMAGIYTMVDNTRGVWKAPANVSVAGVVRPAVAVSSDQQEDLNVNPQGKSVNAIRAFIGEGVLVWGARTLDGNSLDWRYLNVRRTMIMLEESCRLAAKAMVFEPNVANTWVTIKSMITNFLTSVWKRGGLMGAVPEDAFSVHVGLGETMTPDDILEGILRVTVLVAMVRPAEFIEITFQQQMPKS